MRKLILPVVMVLAIVIAASTRCQWRNKYLPESITPEITLKAPSDYEIGELIYLDASESDVDSLTWEIWPPSPNFKIIENRKKAVLSSPDYIDYLIIISGCKGSEVTSMIYLLSPRILEAEPELAPLEPYPIEIPFEIEILPLPGPDPAFEAEVLGWLPKDRTELTTRRLAENFEIIADLIDDGIIANIGEALKQTTVFNRKIIENDKTQIWVPFFSKLENYLERQKFENLRDYSRTWRDIGKILKEN